MPLVELKAKDHVENASLALRANTFLLGLELYTAPAPHPRKLGLHHHLHKSPECAQPGRHSSGFFQQGLHRLERGQGLRAEAVHAPAQTH